MHDKDTGAEEKENEIAQAKEYLEKVVKELRSREGKLQRVEQEISRLEYEMRGSEDYRRLVGGSALKVLSREAYRKTILAELERQRRMRIELTDEVRLAVERKSMAEDELKQLGAIEPNEGVDLRVHKNRHLLTGQK